MVALGGGLFLMREVPLETQVGAPCIKIYFTLDGSDPRVTVSIPS